MRNWFSCKIPVLQKTETGVTNKRTCHSINSAGILEKKDSGITKIVNRSDKIQSINRHDKRI